MQKHLPTITARPQGELKQDFESALGELHGDSLKAAAHRAPIVSRRRPIHQTFDTKQQALKIAASALASLWGL